MKKTRYLFLMLLMSFVAMSVEAQQRNALQIPDVMTQIGNVQLPVSIDNADEIVGAQFDLTLPEGVTAETTGMLSNRSEGHTVTVSRLNSGIYRVLLHSAQNSPIHGQSGVVMYLPISIPESFKEGTEHPLAISNAVLCKVTGENVLTEVIGGNIRIAKLPDLTVKNITCDKQILTPDDRIVCSWQVENIGELATSGGWCEQVSLITEYGAQSKLIATTHYDGILDACSIVSRQIEIALPAIMGIDGQTRLQVRVIPDSDSGEKISAQGNNTSRAIEVFTVNKQLYVELNPATVNEDSGRNIALKVSRSGDWSVEQTFELSATADSRVTLPSKVTIPVGQSGEIVYLTITDNQVLDDNRIVVITAKGNNYPDATGQLSIEDNEYPDLTLTTSKSEISEGESFRLTITTNRVAVQPIIINLTSEDTKCFSFPQTVTIPAGETSATVEVTAIDDEIPNHIRSNVFVASASLYNKAETIVLLKDNDLPVLELLLTPTTVQESVGVMGVAGVLRRTTNINHKITVKLTDDADGGLYFGNRTLVLDKGVDEVHFNFGPVDNAIVDGDRTYTITAAVWLSSCSCNVSGASAGYVEAKLQVLDNDGFALNITSSLSTVKEGDKTTLTVNRNATDTSKALTVILNSDYDEGLTYNKTVTIPAGQQSATIEVTSAANAVQGDSHTVIFTVEAEGYAKGTCYIMVTDQTLPDARISCIVSDVSEVEVGMKAKLTITVCNDGNAELPAETAVKVYLRGNSTAEGTVYTNEAIAIGGSQTITKTITLPNVLGQHRYYAVVNQEKTVQELINTNNTSNDVTIITLSPFTVSISTDKSIYRQGDKVLITGQLTGRNIVDTDIDIYMMNDGARQVQTVKTDANGAFTYQWNLYALQSGHFAVGACYPRENKTTEMAAFDVYGLRRSNSGYITCEIAQGETMTGQIVFNNPGVLSLSNVKAEILSKPDNCEAMVQIPSIIEGGTTTQMNYSLKGIAASAERKWYEVEVRITTDEGISQDVTIYFYCYSQRAQLVSNMKRLDTSITQGTTRDYPLLIVNEGKGESGNISLALPEFMTCESGTTLPSINQNDSITVILRMRTNNKMQLNLPVTGTIGVNCVNGDGLTIDYSVEMVSEKTGTLQVDICDEYTYNTAEAPHVANAEVVICHPYTGAELARGITANDGTYSIELPAGYYKVSVSADKHEQYTNYCSVNPGTTERLVVNISYQPITIKWSVEETEVEDVYEIVPTVQYETNVPKPVVKVTIPNSIDGDNMAVGDAVMINMQLTNVGLINAEEVELDLPTNMTEWKFEPLAYTVPFMLAPLQTVTIPVLITRIADGSAEESVAFSRSYKNAMEDAVDNFTQNFANCMAGLGAYYKALCGKDLKTNHAAERLAMKACVYAATMQSIGDVLSGILGDGVLKNPGGSSGGSGGSPGGLSGGGGSSSGNGSGTNYGVVTQTFDICDPCEAEMAERLINNLIGFTGLGTFDSFLTQTIAEVQNGGEIDLRFVAKVISNYIWDKVKVAIPNRYFNGSGTLIDYTDKITGLIKPCEQTEPDMAQNVTNDFRSTQKRRISKHSWQEKFAEIAETYINHLNAMDSIMLFIYGDRIWYEEIDEEKATFISYISQLEDGYVLSDAELMAHKPSSVTEEQMMAYVVHVLGETALSVEELKKYIDTYQRINKEAVKEGYESMTDCFNDAYENYKKNFAEMKSSSVCASITLQFKQTMTMTRQAFRGSLFVFNGHESLPMKDVRLNLKVFNHQTGQVATMHEFQINPESLDGFQGSLDLSSGWKLDANATGTATVLFIPTKHAAPENPVEWSFGGTLSYIDPFTGLEVSRELYPVILTVKPSPELDLTYFMQRDIYGDDVQTPDVVESMKPAEFALLISNKGNGDATNVRMVTQQPEIIDNEKGLYIDFELISSQMNGGDAVLSFGQSIANDFGTIPAHSQLYAQWWLTSTLLGHFTDYKVETTHVTSYGNEDLSLLDNVTIHELIHGFNMPEGFLTGGPKIGRAFLVNDIADVNDLPDKLYFTNGDTASVAQTMMANIIRKSDTECELTITPSVSGWNYGSVLDPMYGKAELKNIVRKCDGKELGTTRFWQTDRTLRDGKDWLYEYRLHFVDEFDTDEAQTYTLTFAPVPETGLAVKSIGTVPAEGEIAEVPIETLTVEFNKEIDATSFTGDDITFTVKGVKKNANQIGISTEDNKRFLLDMSAMNDTLNNGYYAMTIHTANITDCEGHNGNEGKQINWILFRGGLVMLNAAVWPEKSGNINFTFDNQGGSHRVVGNNDVNGGMVKYGAIIEFTATPGKGRQFLNWTLNGEVVSSDPTFTVTALSDMNVVANFSSVPILIKVEESENGHIEGLGTGIYEQHADLTFIAVPDDDYVLKHWIVNDKEINEINEILKLHADEPMTVKAIFEREFYHQTITLTRGWNWVSSYISEAWSVDYMNQYANRVVGQFDELIRDPQYGLVGGLEQLSSGVAYKVEAQERFSMSFRGHLITTPITLKKGWNWVAYPWTGTRLVSTTITEPEEGDYLVSQFGFTEYADGYWEGSLRTLTPGEGYLYKSASTKTLVFDFSNAPARSRKKQFAVHRAQLTVDEDLMGNNYPNTMNVIARLYQEGQELSGDNWKVYAMNGDELRGVGEYIGNNYYLTVYGNQPVDITFICESIETGKTYVANETLRFCDDVVGSRKSPFAITIGNGTGVEQLYNEQKTITVYSVEGILVGRNLTPKMLHKLPQGVYIINGQKCYVK